MTKRCTRCGEEKPLEEYGRARGYRMGRNSRCRACIRIVSAEWKAAHPEQVKSGNARYRREQPDRVRASKRAYKASPKGIAMEASAEYRSAAVQRTLRWLREHPDRRNAYARQRREALRFAAGAVTTEELAELLTANEGKCAYCPNFADTFDHVVPLSRGGEHVLENILPACRPCNSSKSDSPLWDWMNRRAAVEQALRTSMSSEMRACS
jgi:5-methylcytosine-specific restriction endonuclease McrA